MKKRRTLYVFSPSARICDEIGASGHMPVKHLANSNGSRYNLPACSLKKALTDARTLPLQLSSGLLLPCLLPFSLILTLLFCFSPRKSFASESQGFHTALSFSVFSPSVFSSSVLSLDPLSAEIHSQVFPSWLTEEEVHITLPKAEREYRLLWLSDLHLIDENDPEVKEEYQDTVKERRALMTKDGLSAAYLWQEFPELLDQYNADCIIFGGDLLDYVSMSNLYILQEGLDRLKTPWIYIRADHDYGRWYGDMTLSEMRKAHRKIADQKKVWTFETDDFLLVGLDNTSSILSDEAIDEFESLTEKGKPIILLTHVPLDLSPDLKKGSQEIPSLAELSERSWNGRSLLWGEGDFYDSSKSENMTRLLGLVRGENSPVLEVLAGHLHFSWDGYISETCREHIFSPAFQGTVGVITLNA